MSTLTHEAAPTPTTPLSVRRVPRVRKKPRTKARFVIAGLVIFAAIGYMIYAAIQSGSEYFVTTTELKAMGDKAVGQQMKIGGQVVEGSVRWEKGSSSVEFQITDGTQTLPIRYAGVVPDAFQPGAGVILEGKLGADGSFQASTMLAKCASKYEPK